ncbi:MAG: beta-propeller domain-containing protein [Propionibacteriaceae bacterium]|jgi:uncharacterized secreted protein with C-terminal beta-propeller domain|nr:beta-propeller domain-containing protein [Propionibacteriaceae bacterium]
MTKDIFRDMAEQMKPSEELVAGLLARLDEPEQPATVPAPAPARPRLTWLTAAACLVACVGLVGVTFGPLLVPLRVTTDPLTVPGAYTVASYSELYGKVSAATASYGCDGDLCYVAGMGEAVAVDDGSQRIEAPLPATDTGGMTSAAESAQNYSSPGSAGFTGTNVQVDEIDEGDIVKTDGKAIFILSGTEVAVVAPDGADTGKLAEFNVAANVGKSDNYSPSEMLLAANTLAVVLQGWTDTDSPAGAITQSETLAALYDVADPAHPKLVKTFGQSGYYQSSRLNGGILYLVSVHDVYQPVEEQPETYVPQGSEDGETVLCPVGDIAVTPAPSSAAYTVISSTDVAARERIALKSVLAGAGTVYMSESNLYLAGGNSHLAIPADAGSPTSGGLGYSTHLVRVELADGDLNIAAQGDVAGNLLNQFALDEYDGNLRVATTTETAATLTVLNLRLKEVGKIGELVKDEQIRSVRFEGPVGYMVTFRQTDPLFAIDLSTPSKPKVLSALQIPGFSSYLHPWGEGQLLGLGFQGDYEGLTSGLKLSMFDVSDPLDVTEQATTEIAFEGSDASYEHRAIYVDLERGLIGFDVYAYHGPYGNVVRHFLIYTYADGKFKLRADLEPDASESDWTFRGLRIQDSFYLCQNSRVTVYDANSFDLQATVKL